MILEIIVRKLLMINCLINLVCLILYKTNLSAIDNLIVIDIWNMLKRKTMGDYHDLYLKKEMFYY